METGKLIESNNILAVKLHKLLSRKRQNFFFSPFSLSSAFAMLLYGVRGSTSSEIRKILGYDSISNDILGYAFRDLIDSLEKFPEGCVVCYANSLMTSKDFDVNQDFTTALVNYFKTHPLQVNFLDASAAVNEINNWVKDKTQNKIPQFVETLDDRTIMIILNAIYFKGFWSKQFKEKSTFMQYFYNGGIEDDAPLVEMMHLNETFLFVEKDSFKALQLPYQGEEIAMLILLPNSRDGLEELEDLISCCSISVLKKEMAKCKVEVALPKFHLEYSCDLKETFKELGMRQIFENGADFSGITDSKNISLSKILHRAVLDVSEEGCEAAAVTAVTVMCRSIDFCPEFIVDHPFLFVIYNVMNDLILFTGSVREL